MLAGNKRTKRTRKDVFELIHDVGKRFNIGLLKSVLLKKLGLMFCFLFLVVDAGASDTERRDWSLFVFVVIDVDVERHAPELGIVKVFFNFGCRWDFVGIALVHRVVGQHQLVHEVYKVLSTREPSVGELGLDAVVLATEVTRVVEVV